MSPQHLPKQPHPHAALIALWAEDMGRNWRIVWQCRRRENGAIWQNDPQPQWFIECDYRRAPAPDVVRYLLLRPEAGFDSLEYAKSFGLPFARVTFPGDGGPPRIELVRGEGC